MEKLRSVDQINLRDSMGALYSWAWASAGAIAFGWWQRSIAAGIFALVPLLFAILLSEYVYEIMLIVRVAVQNQESQIGNLASQRKDWAAN